ncbi:MAG: hypothetical protein ACFE7R_04355 [Candidatus Hodarchaeota archaeon]
MPNYSIYNIVRVRKLLKAAFPQTSDLDEFCQDYYNEVRQKFSERMPVSERIVILFDHCPSDYAVEQLLGRIRQHLIDLGKLDLWNQYTPFERQSGPNLGLASQNPLGAQLPSMDSRMRVTVAVLALREADLCNLCTENIDSDFDYNSIYGTHPHQWRPFASGETVEQLLENAELQAELNVDIELTTDELLEAVEDQARFLSFLGKPRIYVIDCLSLEMDNHRSVVEEIDHLVTTNHAGCLTPICQTRPRPMRERMLATRDTVLCRARIRYQQRSRLIDLDISTAEQFLRSLGLIIQEIVSAKAIQSTWHALPIERMAQHQQILSLPIDQSEAGQVVVLILGGIRR